MKPVRISPGPAAAHAFRLGVGAGALVGLGGIGLLYWVGSLTPAFVAYALVYLFPVYLVFVAAALSVWLGYDKDETALRPVVRER
ncbi:hypothetical protein [Haloarcula nitratireducens]|uniref:Uncharacterized protein n=1 Tax=Haloarcula nitratireducens TaxID=2487749 RepID=A0AAW4PKL0_9EURY|nr:hypothetical protein [Halomicroarcula nitratireducens]MBX0297747.1 hypothetical protein [Halomicroarcula nitratireducens]